MAAPIVYKSTDASAPTLDGQKGSLITVLKACLVNGYGAKSAAGWTIALEDAPNYKIIFRNNDTVGSGHYFRFQDNGFIASSGTSYHLSERACNAALVGMSSYIDINTPVMPFPRVISGGDLYDSYAYGVTIRKSYSTTNPTYVKPWIVIADNRTCWLITTTSDSNSTTIPTSRATGAYSNNTGVGITGFGDIRLFNTGLASCPESFVLGGVLSEIDIRTYGNYEGLPVHSNLGSIRHGLSNIYLNRSFETASYSVQGYLKAQKFSQNTRIGGICTPSPDVGTYAKFYDGVSDLEITPIIVCEYLNDPIRTYRTSAYQNSAEFGYLPGVLGCLHTTATSPATRVGDELTTKTLNSKDYLLYSLNNQEFNPPDGSELLAFDLTDWWA